MNEESKELWKLILYRYVHNYAKFFNEKDFKIISVITYNNEIYIVTFKSESKTHKVELDKNVIQHFINSFKIPDDSEIILDKNLNFKQIFKNEK